MPASTAVSEASQSASRGPSNPNGQFPEKLYDMLEYADEAGLCDVVSWLSRGRAFRIHDADAFMSRVAGRFFRATKLRSVQRQLLLWGFRRIAHGTDRDAWFHEHFLRGQKEETAKMVRTTIKTKSLSRAAKADLSMEAVPYMPVPEDVLKKFIAQAKPGLCQVPSMEAVAYVPVADEELKLMMAGDGERSREATRPTMKPRRVSLEISTSPTMDFLVANEPPSPMECRNRYPGNNAEHSSKEFEIEPYAIDVNGEQVHCNVDEFSLFIGQMIRDPST